MSFTTQKNIISVAGENWGWEVRIRVHIYFVYSSFHHLFGILPADFLQRTSFMWSLKTLTNYLWFRILEFAGIDVTIVYFLRETEWNQFNCWQFTFGNGFVYVMSSGNPHSLIALPARCSTVEFRSYGCKYSTGTRKLLLPNVVFFISDGRS